MTYERRTLQYERVEDRRHRGGEVEAGDAGPHRQRHPPVGGGEQLVAQPVPLGAEGEDGARRRSPPGRSPPPPGRAPAAASPRVRSAPARPRRRRAARSGARPRRGPRRGARDRSRRSSAAPPRRPPQRPARRHRGCPCCAAARAGRPAPRAGSASTAPRSAPLRRAIATTPVGGACGTSPASSSASILLTTASKRPARSGARSAASPSSSPGSTATAILHLRPEAQRVLQRVEPFQHGQPRIPARAPNRAELVVSHREHPPRLVRPQGDP